MKPDIVTARYLRAAGAAYLRYDRQCPIISIERGLTEFHWNDSPDILGVTKKRTLVEIEIKVSLSDFKHNFKKKSILMREGGHQCRRPHQFFFLVPPDLVEKVQASGLVTREGLLTVDMESRRSAYTKLKEVKTIKRATVECGDKLTITQMLRLVKHQSGSVVNLLVNQAHQEVGIDRRWEELVQI
jgi:hypothetical protein